MCLARWSHRWLSHAPPDCCVGADLAALINEAAIFAARSGAAALSNEHIDTAYEKIVLGISALRRSSAVRTAGFGPSSAASRHLSRRFHRYHRLLLRHRLCHHHRLHLHRLHVHLHLRLCA